MTGIGALASTGLVFSFFSIGSLCQLAVTLFVQEEWPEDIFDPKRTINGLLTQLQWSTMRLYFSAKAIDSKSFVADEAGVQKNPMQVQQMLNSNLSAERYDIKLDLSAYSGLGEDYEKVSLSKVVEFADFECPACRGAAANLKTVAEKFGDKVLFVFKIIH